MTKFTEWIPGIPAKQRRPKPAKKGKELLPGIGSTIARALRAAGLDSIEKIRHASDEELLAISGISDARLATIRAALSEVT